jgi:hypothetical protein
MRVYACDILNLDVDPPRIIHSYRVGPWYAHLVHALACLVKRQPLWIGTSVFIRLGGRWEED